MNPFGSASQSTIEADDNNDGSGFLHPESSLSSSRGLHDSEWTKERSSQQLELEDVNSADNRGCCAKSLEWAVKILHILNLSFGIALIVYGSLLLTQFDTPAMAAVTFCLLLGSLHFITSLAGIISYFVKGGRCRRFGLIVSAYIGPYIALMYLTIVISWGMNTEGFLMYLDDHKEVMYMGPCVAENCHKLMPLFYTILVVLGFLEASRWPVVMKTHARLRNQDTADPLIPQSGTTAIGGGGASVRSGKSNKSSKSKSKSNKKNGGGNSSLTEALLENDAENGGEEDHGTVKMESTGTPNWWDNK